jgi:gluconate 2-dehydrogenase gamma chain
MKMDRREAIKRTAWIMGGVVSAPAIAAIMKGCKAEPDVNWKPVFLTKEQALIVMEVAEIIIPKTDTPGAKDVGVPAFIDLVVKDCYNKEDQDRFLAGLQEFDAAAKQSYGSIFMDLDASKQQEHVKKVHDAAIEVEKTTQPAPKRPFILLMKELTMLGFFTSKVGATEVLQYDPVPGGYKSCIPLKEAGNGKTWA